MVGQPCFKLCVCLTVSADETAEGTDRVHVKLSRLSTDPPQGVPGTGRGRNDGHASPRPPCQLSRGGHDQSPAGGRGRDRHEGRESRSFHASTQSRWWVTCHFRMGDSLCVGVCLSSELRMIVTQFLKDVQKISYRREILLDRKF